MNEYHLPHNHGDLKGAERLSAVLSESNKFSSASDVFRLLSDPVRLKIFWLLSHREECVINISAMLNMSSPAVSHHLSAMKDSEIIESRRDGKEVYYKVSDKEECFLLHEMTEKLLMTACPSKDVTDPKSHREIITEIHDYMINHLSERITIEDLSKKFLINRTTLKKIFKEVYGTSLACHVNSHRMEKAANLLTTTPLSISEIAAMVGFNGQSRFTQSFSKHYGLTPTNYRKSH